MSDGEVSDLQIYHEEKFVVDYRGTAHTFDSKDEAAAFIYGVECSRNLPDIEGTPASMPTESRETMIEAEAEESYSEFVREVNTATDAAIAKAIPSVPHLAGVGFNGISAAPETD